MKTLKELREALEKLTARAAELQKTDGMDADAIRAAETEHEDVLRQITEAKAEIAKREAEEADAERSRSAKDKKKDDDRTRSQPDDGRTETRSEVDHTAVVRDAIRAERQRTAEIRSICQRHGLPDSFADKHINEESDLATVRTAALDELAKRSATEPSFPHVETGMGRQDETETRRRGMADAIAARMARAAGDRNAQIPEHARQWGERSLAEIAAECVGHRGALITPRQVHDIFQRAMGHHTTSDFAGIFTDAMHVRLMARYQAAMPTYRRFFGRYSAADFRPTNVIRAGDFPALRPVGESGEIKGGTFSESKEMFRVHPYGVQFRISRQMMVNDQLGAIDQVLGSTGDRVADWENGVAFALVAAGAGNGPTLLTDNTVMFHSDHGNKGSAGAINVTNIGLGRAAMMKQTTLDGIKANFQPVLLLTGPDKITEAEQLVTTITPAQQSNAIPESIRRLQPVGDANISGNAWYLFADPQVAPNFVYGYLEGFEGPRLTTDSDFDVQGMKVKLEHDFGVAGVDYRGGYLVPHS